MTPNIFAAAGVVKRCFVYYFKHVRNYIQASFKVVPTLPSTSTCRNWHGRGQRHRINENTDIPPKARSGITKAKHVDHMKNKKTEKGEHFNEALKQLCKCPICLEPFQDPRSLLCRHAFCFRCLEPLVFNQVCIRCPICRATFLIRGGKNGLRRDLTMVKLQEIMKEK